MPYVIARYIALIAAAALLSGVALGCGSDPEPELSPDVQSTIDATVSAATPTPVTTIEPTATAPAPIDPSQPAPVSESPPPEGIESQGLPPDGLIPVELGDPQQFFAELSPEERSCLGDSGMGPRELAMLSDPPPGGSPEVTAAIVNCLRDDTVLRLFLTQLVGQVEPFEMETSACIRDGFVPPPRG